MRRLAKLGLIEYAPYRGALLTAEGEALARRMVRRHRLIERFLTEVLDYPWEEVHDEAESLEHAVSARFIEAIDRLMERPLTDPHGAPIPQRDGSMVEGRYVPLETIEAPATVTVRRVRDSDADLLRYFGDHGIRPGAVLEVVDRSRHDGPISVRVGDRTVHLGATAASGVYVEPNEVH